MSGYRLKRPVQLAPVVEDTSTLVSDAAATHRVEVFLEMEGVNYYLPPFAGNLDIAVPVVEAVALDRATAVPT